MEVFVFGIGSLVLLIPILFLLPLGLTAKGKIVTALIASFLAIGTSLGDGIFEPWQMGLLLFLFSGLIAYVMNGKLGDFLYTKKVLVEGWNSQIQKGTADDHRRLPEIDEVVFEDKREDVLIAAKDPQVGKDLQISIDENNLYQISSLSEVAVSGMDNEVEVSFLDDIGFDISTEASPIEPSVILSEEKTGSVDESLPLLDFDIVDPNQSKELRGSMIEVEEEYLSAVLEVAAGIKQADR
ncbi:hypothetical protein AM500_08365 [Bacillus sp. FJAT-18017]|uniref:hypothetical protein n=1 Tax=Bacillus sp. FJAT-18017 TaxID=1705566 RepID=UPI0006AF244D|nr:hypothetical protein [Bacillus sp. FJAT-18017]ALC89784.1 hypothetical protein AM500_08365 [Bacillus sp. FJAT-18017]